MRRMFFLQLNVWVVALAIAGLVSCGDKEMQYDTNLLVNPSFEEVGRDGIPKGWELTLVRGLPGQQEVQYSVDDNVAVDGEKSWKFTGDPGTRRWYTLSQEIEVKDLDHVHLEGWMQLEGVTVNPDQWPMCNFLITFRDKNHSRFMETRIADQRTRFRNGSNLWRKEEIDFRVPNGTHYVSVAVILGCDGTVWFDNLTLSIPPPHPWLSASTDNYVFHWFKERPYPPEAMAEQQGLFDHYAARLGVKSDVVINYYFYPDSATIRDILGLRGVQYVSWDDREMHTLAVHDDHELVHFITDEYGQPPRAFAEGTVVWLQGNYRGFPIEASAAYALRTGQLARLQQLATYAAYVKLPAEIAMASAGSFISFLVDRAGPETLLQFYGAVNGMNTYTEFAQAVEAVYKVPCDELEQIWRSRLSTVPIDGPVERIPELDDHQGHSH